MGGGDLGGQFGGAGLEHDDSLLLHPRATRRRGEGRCIAEGLGEHHDDLGVLVLNQKIHAGGDIEHGFVAGGDAHRQTDVAVVRHVGDLEPGGAALRHQRYLARKEGRMKRHRRQRGADGEVGETQAVGPEEGHARGTGPPREFVLEPGPFLADFREAGGQDDGRLDPAGDHIVEGLERGFEGDHQVGGIHGLRNLRARKESRITVRCRTGLVDRVDAPGETDALEVGMQQLRPGRAFGRADQCDRLRIEQPLQRLRIETARTCSGALAIVAGRADLRAFCMVHLVFSFLPRLQAAAGTARHPNHRKVARASTSRWN